jgi:hypothetical protein
MRLLPCDARDEEQEGERKRQSPEASSDWSDVRKPDHPRPEGKRGIPKEQCGKGERMGFCGVTHGRPLRWL